MSTVEIPLWVAVVVTVLPLLAAGLTAWFDHYSWKRIRQATAMVEAAQELMDAVIAEDDKRGVSALDRYYRALFPE